MDFTPEQLNINNKLVIDHLPGHDNDHLD